MKFSRILGIYNEEKHKIINILGLKIKLKRKQEIDFQKLLNGTRVRIIQDVQRSINTALLHQKTFPPFKNKYQGATMVLVGAGPTVNKFTPLPNAVYVGCNRAFLLDKIKFDYLFSIDKVGIDQYYEDFLAYTGNNCIKFIGDQNKGKDFQIPESYVLKLGNIKRYKTVSGYLPDRFPLDIDTEPLGNGASVALQAVQFMLYTNPKKIYIVGIDCTTASKKHFVGKSFNNESRNENSKQVDDYNIMSWQKIKEFAQTYYPETEIISINPVGLKGIFKDIYTDDAGNYIDNLGNPVII